MRKLALASACIIASSSGLALGAAPSSAASTAAPGSTIDYQLTPELKGGRLDALAVRISLEGDPDGETHIRLPDKWSGVEELHKAIGDLKAQGARVRRLSPAEVVLTHAPRAPISLSYRVRQSFEGELEAGSPPFRASVMSDRFTVLGWAVFGEVAAPVGRPVAFRWGPTPEGWTVASDLDHGVAHTGDLLDSVLMGGDGMQLIEREAAGGRLRVAVHGTWRFQPADLSDLLVKVAETSSQFWGDREDDFFVAVTPLANPRGGSAQYGVGLSDAFSLWTTRDSSEASLRHIVTHEHQHVWFPGRVGGVRTGADEPLDYWLSEGFTDFYTLRLLLRSGEWSLEDFAAAYNRILREYASSPVQGAPNAVIQAGFWEDPNVADLPYQRGLMLAALWDDRLRRSTGGRNDLDDVVMAMKNRAENGGRNAIENLRLSYASLGGKGLENDLRALVDQGAPVSLPADMFGACATIRTVETPTFDRGFDSAATNAQGGIAVGVDPQGPAYRAGLRNGMRIVARSGGLDQDPNAELLYQVADKTGVKQIRYRPAGRTVAVQEVVLAQDLDEAKRAACARRMGGL